MTNESNDRLGETPSRRQFLAGLASAVAAGAAMSVGAKPAGSAETPSKKRWEMRLSTSSSHFSSLSVEKACERIAALGFEAVDFWPSNFECPHLDEIEKRLGPDGLKEVLATNRLKLYAFTCYHHGYVRYAKLLHQCGGGVAIRESKYGPNYRHAKLDQATVSAEMKTLMEGMKPEIELAEKYGDYIAIENHADALLNSLDSFKTFVEMNPSKHLGIALAPHHLQICRVPMEEVVRVAGKQIFFVYGWQFASGMKQLPGIGPLDFTPLLRALAKVDYSWYVNPFMHHQPGADEMSGALAKSRDYLLKCYREAIQG